MDEKLQQNEGLPDSPPVRDPREVVEAYLPGQPKEVVLYYYSNHRLVARAPVTVRSVTPPPPKRSKKPLWIAFGFLVALLLSVAGALLWQQYGPDSGEDDYSYDPGYAYDYEEGSGTVTIPTEALNPDIQLDIRTEHGKVLIPQEIYQQVGPSTVTVMTQLEDGMSVGTGILFTSDGYLLTNFHVVEDGTSCTVGLMDGSMYDAKYVAGDKDNDIAILKMDGTNLPAAQMGNSDALSVGDPVYAIGNPLGLELRHTFTDGIVSAINRDVWVDGRTMTLVQTNTALNSGNSGGPLINQYGQVVGINTVKMSSKYSTIEGLGFALPTSSIAHLINDLMATGKVQPETALGITVAPAAQALPDGTWGLLVHEVIGGSGADEAGILPGDIIVKAAGQPVTSSAALLRIRRDLHVDDTLVLTLWRDGAYLNADVVLQAAEDSSANDFDFDWSAEP